MTFVSVLDYASDSRLTKKYSSKKTDSHDSEANFIDDVFNQSSLIADELELGKQP